MNRLFIALIGFYRKHLSQLKGKPCCRFYPTCSQYAIMCFERFNFFKALALSVWRLLRCNPFCKGGVDYPPEVIKRGDTDEIV